MDSVADHDICAGRSPSSAMLTPSAATSLVNTALEWFQGSTAKAFLSALCLPSQHSANSLPAVTSAYAAVVGFLNTHIHARQVTSHLLTSTSIAYSAQVFHMVLAQNFACNGVKSAASLLP